MKNEQNKNNLTDEQSDVLCLWLKSKMMIMDENDNTILADLKEPVGGIRPTRLWYNDNGVLKKVKKVYFNDDGKIKVHSNFGG